MKKSLIIKISVVVLLIATTIISLNFYNAKATKGALNSGEITLVIENNSTILHKKTYSVRKEETLFDILWNEKEELEFGCNNEFYTNIDYKCETNKTIRTLMGIEAWNENYWKILIDDVSATKGINEATFKSNAEIKIILT